MRILKKKKHTHHYFLKGNVNIRIHTMRNSFTVIKAGNYFLVKHVYKVKHTDYINPGRTADVGLPLENCSDGTSLKNKDVLSETKHSYAHELEVVNGLPARRAVPSSHKVYMPLNTDINSFTSLLEETKKVDQTLCHIHSLDCCRLRLGILFYKELASSTMKKLWFKTQYMSGMLWI